MRRSMYRTLIALLCAFGATLLVVGLTFSASAPVPADLRFVNGTEPRTLDPHLATGQPEGRILWALFEGLTRNEARTLKPAPGMAESWTLSADGKTYTFRLRPDAAWSDGTPITAHDFVYSWKRLLDPKLGSEYAYILYPVRYAEAFNAHAGHADLLESRVLPGLDALRREHPDGVDAARWQAFLTRHHAHDAIGAEGDRDAGQLLARRDGHVSPRELARFEQTVKDAVTARRRSASEARRRFGVDGGVFARDDRTLVVELRAPTPYFLQITSFYSTMPVPRHVVEAHPGDWFVPGKIVSNGPFSLESWTVNDRIRLARNERYWGREEVRAGRIDALSLENDTTALNLYLTGEVDWLPATYPTDLVDALKDRPDFYKNPGLVVYFYRFNTTRPPFDDRRVREAINLAVDRRVLVDEVLGLGQLPAAHIVPPGIPGYEPPESRIRFDVQRARALLAEAGYPGGRGLRPLGILYNTHEQHKKIAEVIADQLRQNLGIRVKAYNQEWQSYLATEVSGDYDMSRAGWIGDYADPNTFLDMWVTNGGNNRTGFASPRYDRLIRTAADVASFVEDPGTLLDALAEPERARRWIAAAREAPAPEARVEALARLRMELLREAEAILVGEELPILPLYFYVVSGLVRPEVQGFYSTLVFDDGTTAPNVQDLHPLRDIWVDRGSERTP